MCGLYNDFLTLPHLLGLPAVLCFSRIPLPYLCLWSDVRVLEKAVSQNTWMADGGPALERTRTPVVV